LRKKASEGILWHSENKSVVCVGVNGRKHQRTFQPNIMIKSLAIVHISNPFRIHCGIWCSSSFMYKYVPKFSIHTYQIQLLPIVQFWAQYNILKLALIINI